MHVQGGAGFRSGLGAGVHFIQALQIASLWYCNLCPSAPESPREFWEIFVYVLPSVLTTRRLERLHDMK